MLRPIVLLCLWFIILATCSDVHIPEYRSNAVVWPGKAQQSYPCQIAANSTHKVLVFVDSNFFDLFRNWHIYYHHTCGKQTDNKHLLIICMDDNAQKSLKALRIPNVVCNSDYNVLSSLKSYRDAETNTDRLSLPSVWMKRLVIINDLLSKGIDLILSDTDAFWLNNPYPEVSRHAATSVIVSSRGWFPFSISRIWGSTVCMGFMYIKSDPFTIALFRKVLDKMLQKDLEARAHKHYESTKNTLYVDPMLNRTIIFDIKRWNRDENKFPDDQYAINEALRDMQIRWPANMSKTLTTESHIGEVMWQDRAVGVTLLQEQTFMRNCANNRMHLRYVKFRPPSKVLHEYIAKKVGEAVIAHCFLSPHATGEFDKKKHYLVYYSLWRLPYDAKVSSEFIYKDFQKYSDRYDYNETDIGYVPKRRGPQSATVSTSPLTGQIGQRRQQPPSSRKQRRERSLN